MDGTGGIVRMKSSYKLRNISVRTHHADGTDVADGPVVSATYPLGYFREDYEFTASAEPDFLDVHNGRFCVTPEYPQGIYAYFATVDEKWNSAYPYVVGPTFYGVRSASKVQTIGEPVTTYNPNSATSESALNNFDIAIFPNPSGDFFAIQIEGLLREKMDLRLFDLSGKLMQQTEIQAGSTIGYFDVRTLYAGVYVVSILVDGQVISNKKVVVE